MNVNTGYYTGKVRMCVTLDYTKVNCLTQYSVPLCK